MAFQAGDVIAGRYVVEREIASGGMGVIYAAKHRVLDEHVAIKCLLPELAKDGEQAARLIREARSAAKIKSEHVARVQDADVLPDGTVFLVMEQLEGTDLAALVEGRGFNGIPIPDAAMYVLQACEALAEAHALGIVHRDLKPANLFLTRTPEGSPVIKVLDFGIAKGLEGNDAIVHTQTGSFLGTPLYASPEQIDTPHDVDVRTDVWALGCVLYELVAGVPPFGGDSIASIVNAIVHKDPSPALSRRLDVPPEFEAIVFRALAKDRTQRIQDVAELAHLLALYAPLQATKTIPRVDAFARRSASLGFASTEIASSGSLRSAPGPSPSGSVRSATAHAPTVGAWQTQTPAFATSPSRGSSSFFAWAALAFLVLGVAGLVLVKLATRVPAAADPATATSTTAVAREVLSDTKPPEPLPPANVLPPEIRDAEAPASAKPRPRPYAAPPPSAKAFDVWKPPTK